MKLLQLRVIAQPVLSSKNPRRNYAVVVSQITAAIKCLGVFDAFGDCVMRMVNQFACALEGLNRPPRRIPAANSIVKALSRKKSFHACDAAELRLALNRVFV
jgi:hypothetical protein